MSGTPETMIDLTGYMPGLYIIVIFDNQEVKTFRYSLVK
jgi:hypothetical protein